MYTLVQWIGRLVSKYRQAWDSVIVVLIHFLVLVSFQFYSIGDVRKYVMICLNTVHR